MDHHEEQDHLIQCKQDDVYMYSDDEYACNEIFSNSSGWNNHNKTLLIFCIERKDERGVIVFLRTGIDPKDSRQGVTALTFAVEGNLPLCVRELVRYGAHFTCEKGVEALELVVSKCFFNELIEGEETLFSQVQSSKLFKTAIVVAFESGRQSLLTKLVHCGLPLERSLLLDVTLKQPGLVEILIDNGVDVNVSTSSLDTALHKSAQNNNIGSIQLLIQANSNIHAVNKNGETALYNAVCFVNSREHYKAELSQSDKDINLAIIQLLVEAKSDINIKDLHGDTLLHKAVQLGKTDVVKLLIEAGADANAINKSGETVLHTASVVGHCEIFKATDWNHLKYQRHRCTR